MTEGLFDPLQLECLEAMGLHVFALDGAETVRIAPMLEPAPAPAPAPVAAPRRVAKTVAAAVVAPVPKPVAAPTPVAVQALEQDAAPEAVTAPAPAARRPMVPQTQLERDVLAATGCRRRADSWALVERLGVDFENLRDNPKAKRELWLQLRRERARLR